MLSLVYWNVFPLLRVGLRRKGKAPADPTGSGEILRRDLGKFRRRSQGRGDEPTGHQASITEGMHNAARFLKETGCTAVKLEGGSEVCELVSKLTQAGIPVVAHIGLTPQSVNQLGGFKVQGKDVEAAKKLINDAKALEEAGAFACVLECVPAAACGSTTERESSC